MSSAEIRVLRAAAREQARRKIAEQTLRGRLRFKLTPDGAVLAYGPTGGRGKRIDFNLFLALAEDFEFNALRKQAGR